MALAILLAVTVALVVIESGSGGPRSSRLSTANAQVTSTTEITPSAPPINDAAGNAPDESGEPPASTDSGPITASLEDSVIGSTWKTFSLSFEQGDLSAIAAVATPSVLRVISGYFLCGCGPWTNITREVSFSAPPQSRFPRYFLAEIQSQNYNQTPLNKEVVFAQSAAGEPWLVAYLGAYGVAGPLFVSGSSNSWSGPPQPVPYSLESVPNEFRVWAQQLDTTGVKPPLPPHFGSTGITADAVTSATGAHSFDKTHDLTTSISHTVEAVSPIFGTPGGDLICDAMALTEVTNARSGEGIVQPEDRGVWTAALAPGQYRTVHQEAEYDTCFLEWPDGTIWQQTNMGGFYAAVGT